MPVIEGANLTSVSTEFEPFPEGEYHVTVLGSEFNDDHTALIIENRIDEPAEFAAQNRKFRDYINLRTNDDKWNEIGLSSLKRYIEAVYGKGSPEAESFPPNSDVVHGQTLAMYMTIREYDDKKEKDANGQPVKRRANRVTKIWKI